MSFEPEFDFSELDKLVADLGEVPVRIRPLLEVAVEKVAADLKYDWSEEARLKNRGSAKYYPGSISHEMTSDGLDGNRNEVSAEIGPVLARTQGGLGILEFAPGGVRARPQRNVERALRKNLAGFEKAILAAGEAALGD